MKSPKVMYNLGEIGRVHCCFCNFTNFPKAYAKNLQAERHSVAAGQKIRCGNNQIIYDRNHQHVKKLNVMFAKDIITFFEDI